MKSKNYIYITLVTVSIVLFVIFLTSKLWLPDDRANKTKLYNIQQTVGTYSLKISNAVLDTNKKELTSDLYMMSINPERDPVNYFAYVDGNKNKELICTVTDTAEGTMKRISITDIPETYYYLTIEVRTVSEDATHSSLITSLDYRSIQTIDSRNIVYVYTTLTPTDTPTMIQTTVYLQSESSTTAE